MTSGSRTGQLATINGTALGNGKPFSPAYSATNLTLTVTAPSTPLRAPAAPTRTIPPASYASASSTNPRKA